MPEPKSGRIDGGDKAATVTEPTPTPASAYPIAYRPSKHELDIEDYFAQPGRTFIADPSPLPVKRSLVVCFVNRSGSTWLVDLLAASHKAGRGGEFFNSDVVARQCDQHEHASFDGYLRWLAKRTGRGGCFTFKVGIAQLHYLRKRRIIPELTPRPQYLLCRRKDIASQALSFIKAAHTLEWHRYAGDEPKPFDYDTVSNRQLLKTIQSIAQQYAGFEQYLSVFGIDYVNVFYEDLVADTPGEFARVTKALGIEVADPAKVIAGARTSVMQRDEASERRLSRFHAGMRRR